MLTVIRLTIKEAVRRKFFVGVLLISALFALMINLPFRLGPRARLVPVEVQTMMMAHGGFIMMNFFGAMLAVVMGAGAISSELEKGTLVPILSKPLARWQIYLGKWCGIVIVMVATMYLWAVMGFAALYFLNHQANWFIFKGTLVAIGYPILFATLSLLFSSFASVGLATSLSLIAWGIGWQAKAMRAVGIEFDLDSLRATGDICFYLVPMQRLGVWVDKLHDADPRFVFMGRNPELMPPPPTYWDFAYVAGYLVALLGLGIWLFWRKDAG
jgi:ABC-type transport system involved in multi-copper enzyme maturation permease subunit